jgi:hypothetical protein
MREQKDVKYERTKGGLRSSTKVIHSIKFCKAISIEEYIQAFHQKNISIQDFYYVMTDFWDQLALTESTELKICDAYFACREQQLLVQLLTALRRDFEGLRASILHRSPLSSIDSIINKLLTEEIHLQSYSKKKIIYTSNPFVPALPSKSLSNNQNKHYIRVVFDECSFCKHKGRWKAQYPKLR